MTDEKIEALLWVWAAWQSRLRADALGYGARTPLARMMRRAQGPVDAVPLSVDVDRLGQAIDRQVAALPDGMRRVILLHYVRMPDDPCPVKARIAGCCERTFRARLTMARGRLAEGLDSVAGFRHDFGTLATCVQKPCR